MSLCLIIMNNNDTSNDNICRYALCSRGAPPPEVVMVYWLSCRMRHNVLLLFENIQSQLHWKGSE